MERKHDDILDLLVRCLEAWLTWLEEDNKNLAAEIEEKKWRRENEAYSLNEYTYNWEFTEKWELVGAGGRIRTCEALRRGS